MSFVFTTKRTVKNWPATLFVAANNGDVEQHKISFDLELLPDDQYIELLNKSPKDFFDEAIKGWSGIGCADGTDMTDTPDNREALYNWPPFANAALRAYRQAASGEAARKN
ncbi:hypothetical protein KDN34_02910 [Shewanella yunxiaonensis]|uniref:Uncharacterized protein n=1 Tax=Shewanella yunxiaonensis TaxID=2829809 RepID=A0ABX7YUV8_9GAMM|nr:hypothetical protein [Shewanella yunxiaonensis]QUN06430.1 hypothetical protein KDN34_02910 [Shewanella yunxiaonensis]